LNGADRRAGKERVRVPGYASSRAPRLLAGSTWYGEETVPRCPAPGPQFRVVATGISADGETRGTTSRYSFTIHVPTPPPAEPVLPAMASLMFPGFLKSNTSTGSFCSWHIAKAVASMILSFLSSASANVSRV